MFLRSEQAFCEFVSSWVTYSIEKPFSIQEPGETLKKKKNIKIIQLRTHE
jgi:hypothetical protein